ncbi:MAG: hypothetical protein ACLQBB_13455 [Solirubrobacteraceae bacterium]
MDTAAGDAQQLVRATMIGAGGYWRPLAAVARLLEELGELLELLTASARSHQELASELADLWIITTALADQFLAAVAPPGARPEPGGEVSGRALVVAAGPIARVVNHYDGPKTPRPGAPLPSLADAIAAFHRALAELSASLGVDLDEAVRAKIAAIHRRGDMARFGAGGFDPSTADALNRYSEAVERAAQTGLRAPALWRLWGAPDWRAGTTARNAASIAPWLLRFAKAARAERLQGFLIAGPAFSSDEQRAAWTSALLASLAALDPRREAAQAGGAGELRFDGLPFRGVVLAPRSSDLQDGETFLLLTPADRPQPAGGRSPRSISATSAAKL